MKLPYIFSIIVALLTLSINAQNKTFAFSHFQSRNDIQEWSKGENVGNRTASFTSTHIRLNIDHDYLLNIISKTDLPNKGVIYLCKDQLSNSVTVMLIDNIKMYVYNQSKRFLINFNPVASRNLVADID